jgi:hypothetical protein
LAVVGARHFTLRPRREAERRRHEAEVQRQWLISIDEEASRDPEFRAGLLANGWRVDGPYEAMRAIYFATWAAVKEARRRSGRSVWAAGPASSEASDDDARPNAASPSPEEPPTP